MNAVLGSRYRYSNPDQNVGTSHRAVKTEKQEVPYNARSITEGRRFFVRIKRRDLFRILRISVVGYEMVELISG